LEPAGTDNTVSWLAINHPGCDKSRRCGGATFVIVACIGLVVAAQVGRDRRRGESTDQSAMKETTGSIGDSQRATADRITPADELIG